MANHYNDPIDRPPGRLAGNSRNGGDVSPEVKTQIQQIIISEARNANLTDHEVAYVLAIAETESGFNPDAAAKQPAKGTTSAFGLGQTQDGTAKNLGLDASNMWDATAQAKALVKYYEESKAKSKNMSEGAIYEYYHDGPGRKSDGMETYTSKVAVRIRQWESKLTSQNYDSNGYT